MEEDSRTPKDEEDGHEVEEEEDAEEERNDEEKEKDDKEERDDEEKPAKECHLRADFGLLVRLGSGHQSPSIL